MQPVPSEHDGPDEAHVRGVRHRRINQRRR